MSWVFEGISSAVGWLYVVLWSVYMYPLLYQNYKSKSVKAISLSFLLAMISGQTCYGIYTLCLYFSASARGEYLSQHHLHVHGDVGAVQVPVRFNDVAYSVHGVALAACFAMQWIMYAPKLTGAAARHGFSARVVASGHATLVLAYAALWFCVAVALLAAQIGLVPFAPVLAVVGTAKAVISLFKYAPQVTLHRQLKSADEWNLATILLDLSGASGALLQLFLDAWISGHVDEILANFPKLMLSAVAIWFNIVFLIQRAVLYPKPTSDTA